VAPFWLQTVWRHLGDAGEPHIVTVLADQRVIGVAALALDGPTARFMGSHEVCDYQDLVCAPGYAVQVLASVIDHLAGQGIRQIDLRTLRPDALALAALQHLAPDRCAAGRTVDDVTFETTLPADWEGFLGQLDGKQRHEVRRKVRRLETYGPFAYQAVAPADAPAGTIAAATDCFVDLFRRNRADKADFMNDTMVAYFRDLITALESQHMLRLYFLEVAGQPAATVLCFDYNGVRYLYNSGYDEQYEPLSVGILSKVFSIQAAIAAGCRRFDFLKGAETYKRRIGGQELPLYRCQVAL
jgi:CelD/BcsL family acetyltransferase involved in cellulose biosynthesis